MKKIIILLSLLYLIFTPSYSQDYYEVRYELLTFEATEDTEVEMIEEEKLEWSEYCLEEKNGTFIDSWKIIEKYKEYYVYGSTCKYTEEL